MGRQLKFKTALLASLALIIVGFLCSAPVDHAYGNTLAPVLIEFDPHGLDNCCSGSLPEASFSLAAASARGTNGAAKPGNGTGSALWSPKWDLSLQHADALPGAPRLSFAKVSLNILFCVHAL